VRNDQNCFLSRHLVDGLHNPAFGGDVDRIRRLVENEQLRIAVQGPSNADTLTLSAGQSNAIFPNSCVVASVELLAYKLMDTRRAGRPSDRLPINGRCRFPIGNVAGHGGIHEMNVLGHVPDGALPSLYHIFCKWCSVHPDLSFPGKKQSQNEIDERRLSGSPSSAPRCPIISACRIWFITFSNSTSAPRSSSRTSRMVFSSKDILNWVTVLGRLIRLMMSPINLTDSSDPLLLDPDSDQVTNSVT